ncbi:nSTAND1 domain-containing NTPase [Actinosynnema sp. ALI-1.44]|uniref:nSTAND1 domain-containing NTPase n=1 Tax=Actinosynnema sp. ALI-1.44 TaxID=1933779 RepID=UPI00192D0804|nr:helix-turn-helix domain-containing protein [Actinosynnema sp. ALI-1.44]
MEFAADLRLLRTKAGTPSYREMGRAAHYSATTLSEAAGGRKLPSRAVTLAFVRACGGDEADWEQRWHAVAVELNGKSATTPSDENVTGAPYVGLRAFGPDDANLFFGRERLVDEIISKLDRERMVLLFGASGSGKSSVMRAGVVPALTAAGDTVLLFTPGARPIERCSVRLGSMLGMTAGAVMDECLRDDRGLHRLVAQALDGCDDDATMVIVVDQFEEVFALCEDEDERAKFIKALTTAASTPDSRCRVVLGMRSDFFTHCSAYPALLDAMPDGQVVAGAMSAEELRRAVAEPARRMKCTVESALVADLVAQAYGRPGVLPLVSHVLLQVWARRSGNRLTVSGFQAAGGLDGALSRTAEDVFTGLDKAQQQLARALFGRLVALGKGTEDTKRRLDITELGDDPDLAVVLEAFTAARLLTRDQDGVEITHEALIRAWPRLHGWLHDDRESLRLHRQLTDATDAWESVGRDADALYRGTRLALTLDWTSTHDTALSPREHQFVEASRSAEVRSSRRLRRLVVLLSVLSLLAVTATVFAVRAERNATAQRNAIRAQVVAGEAAALYPTNPDLAVQLGLAAYRLAPSTHTRDGLLSTLPLSVVRHASEVIAVALSSDGRTMATGSDDHTVRLWTIADPRAPVQLATLTGHTQPVYSVGFSPDGRTLATSSFDRTVRLWDVADPQHQMMATLTSHTEAVAAVAFSPDGRTLATAGHDRTVRLWDVADPRKPAELTTFTGYAEALYEIAFSADGRTLAIAGDEAVVQLWNIVDRRHPSALATLTGHDQGVHAVTFSPDGRTLATASDDRTVRLWDVTDPRRPIALPPLTAHNDGVYTVAFSPDGRTLATAGDDRTVRLWDVTDPHRATGLVTLSSHTDAVEVVVFSPDGRTLATGSWDSTVQLLDTDFEQTIARACDHVQTAITRAEWDSYLPGLPYEPPCPG